MLVALNVETLGFDGFQIQQVVAEAGGRGWGKGMSILSPNGRSAMVFTGFSTMSQGLPRDCQGHQGIGIRVEANVDPG